MYHRVHTIPDRLCYEGISTGSIGDEWLRNTNMEWGCEILQTGIKSIGRNRARITISDGGITRKRISLPTKIL